MRAAWMEMIGVFRGDGKINVLLLVGEEHALIRGALHADNWLISIPRAGSSKLFGAKLVILLFKMLSP